MISPPIQKNIVFNSTKQKPISGKLQFGSYLKPIQEDFFTTTTPIITFTARKSVSKETLEYIKEARTEYSKRYNRDLIFLRDLDLDKISDICNGISVFEGWSARDLALATNNMESILLQRGCSHQCTHCGACSQSKITPIQWDNYMDLVKGIDKLQKRLGFNPFAIKKHYCEDYIILFNDSEPMHFSSKDVRGNRHNLFDATKAYYDKTKTPILLTTAGWEKSNDNAQKAAEKFVKKPEYLYSLNISIHPFHAYLARSRKFMEQGQVEKATYWRDKYIDMMANVIKTTYPLKDQIPLYKIALQFAPKKIQPDCSKEVTKALMDDIIKELNQQGILLDLNFLNRHSNYYYPLEIGLIGRAQSLKKENKTSCYYPVDRANSFVRPPEELKETFEKMKPKEIYECTKLINTDGSILLKKGAPRVIDVGFAKLPFKLNFKHPTQWRSDYHYAQIPESNLPQAKDIKSKDKLKKENPWKD